MICERASLVALQRPAPRPDYEDCGCGENHGFLRLELLSRGVSQTLRGEAFFNNVFDMENKLYVQLLYALAASFCLLRWVCPGLCVMHVRVVRGRNVRDLGTG